MKFEKVELNVPKESKEIVDAVDAILEDILAKKSVAEIAAENLTGLFEAVSGFDQLDDEFKAQGRDDLAAYLVQKVMNRLLPVQEA